MTIDDILYKKLSNEVQKALIRRSCPPHIAHGLCNTIDLQEKAKHIYRFLTEYNAWIAAQQMRQMFFQQFMPRCYW